MTRVPHSARSILATITQLQVLEGTLRNKVKGDSAAESLKIRKVLIDAQNLATDLEAIANRTTTRNGAGSIDEVKAKLAAEATKRRAGQLQAKAIDKVQKADAADKEGVMVALVPSPALAQELAVPGGEPVKDLHVTLLYFEDKAADRADWEKLGAVIAQVSARHAKLSGRIAGEGRFKNEEGDVAWASVDLPGLAQLRQDLLAAVEKAGFAVHQNHDYTPHLTLKYLDKNEDFPQKVENQPAKFGKVYLISGDKQIGAYNLGTK